MKTQKLEELFTKYAAIQDAIKPLLTEQDAIKAAVKEELAAIKLDSYSAGGVSATKFTSTRTWYDQKKLEVLFTPEQLEPAKKITQIEQVRLTIAKGGDEK